MLPIKVFIGMSKRFECVKGLTEKSILENTALDVEIVHLYPKKESGCTGFSDVRYTITDGIYLDCDMIVLGDIGELWGYREKGKFVCIEDGSSEVAVIHECNHLCRTKTQEHLLPKRASIPVEWNVEDYKYFPNQPLPKNIKLFHFTALDFQPWFHDHPNDQARELYERYNN